jgi:hypothetical protein
MSFPPINQKLGSLGQAVFNDTGAPDRISKKKKIVE